VCEGGAESLVTSLVPTKINTRTTDTCLIWAAAPPRLLYKIVDATY